VTNNLRIASVRPFQVEFHSLAWYPNHDNTRWFLSLSATKPQNNELNRLLDACNRTAKASQQPVLYLKDDAEDSNPLTKKGKQQKQQETALEPTASQDIPDCSDSFHVSLAWSLSNPLENGYNQTMTTDELKRLSVLFDSVKVKIGNILTSIPLFTKTPKTRSGILH
jgi:hypothetical protein